MTSKSLTVERRRFIMNEIAENGQVFIQDLSNRFKVSEVTIRNDLHQLEKKKILIRARGGAIRFEGIMANEQRITEKNRLHNEEKSRIGKKAAALIQARDTIILDSGTTTVEIAKNMPALEGITVVTNALNIMNQLSSRPDINLIVPGGYLRRTSYSLVGSLAEKNLRNFYVDKVFLGVDGFDTRHGAYTPNLEEASLNQIMIQNAREVILVADSSKFLRKSLAFICDIHSINVIVTDKGLSPQDKQKIEDAGIKLILA